MKKDKTRRILYTTAICVQFLMVGITLVNMLCWLFGESHQVFSGSLISVFIPLKRFAEGGGAIDLFVSVLFLVITVVLTLLAAREYLNIESKKIRFVIMNTIWYLLLLSGIYVAIPNLKECTYADVYILFFVSMMELLAFVLKSEDYKKAKNYGFTGLSASGYDQISRTAKGVCTIEASAFVILCYLKYIGIDRIELFAVVYLLALVFAVFIFFNTIHECKSLERKTKQAPPNESYLKKLSIMQIVTMALFVLSFIIVK